jgi:hypothetical protein
VIRHLTGHQYGHDGVDVPIDVREIEFPTQALHDVVHVSVKILPGRD